MITLNQYWPLSEEVPIRETVDVLVCGAGPAGFAAAIAAARQGATTTLVERYGFVGGMATAGLVGPFMTSFSLDGERQVIKGIFDELVVRMEAEGGAIHPEKVRAGSPYASFIIFGHDHVGPFEPESFKAVALKMLLEAGVKLHLHSFVVRPMLEGNRVSGVVLADKSGLSAIRSKVTIDCTGDADIAFRANAPCVQGRDDDGLTQPMTLFFRIANVDDAVIQAHVDAHPEQRGLLFNPIIEMARDKREFDIPREKIGMYRTLTPGVWRINTTRLIRVDATRPDHLTQAEIDGRKQVEMLMKFFRNYLPGFSQVTLLDTAVQVGARESRRITGEYTLNLEDLKTGRHFDDVIGLCAYPVDIHNPAGVGGGSRKDIPTANVYEMPYRILLPKDVDGLLVAGRCVSATHEALGAIRVMPPCFATGQAAGTAAALACRAGTEPRNVPVPLLQINLLKQDVILA